MKSKKYTLIELLVVLFIIAMGILFLVALVIGGIFAYKGYTATKEVGVKQSLEEVWEGPQTATENIEEISPKELDNNE